MKDISNQLTEQSDGSYQNLENDISVTYPASITSGITLQYGDVKLNVKPMTTDREHGLGSVVYHADQPSVVSYPGAFGLQTSLRYTQTFSGYKEDIVLSADLGTQTFVFKSSPMALIRDATVHTMEDSCVCQAKA